MPKPNADWFDRLPADRCLAEFSMWSADLCNLTGELARIQPHADMLHIDVADGVFAPSFLFFPDLVGSMRARSSVPIHVHLMVDDAILLSQIEQFAEAGADLISVHAEHRLASEAVRLIHDRGLLAGAVLRVESPLEVVTPILADLNIVTLLGTAIGVKGQGLSETAAGRIAAMQEMVAEAKAPQRQIVAADGGIRENTVPLLVASGAQTVVLGSLAFGAPDLAARINWLHGLNMG
ncbi:MAG TPA: ribulose-phosphate 3-epimerase [Aestuariivirga sp.]|nr:ribulose-phosphate 3-epimerase [Aestuariivirga sp.]